MTQPPAPPPQQPLSGLGIFCVVLGFLLAIPSGACAGIIVIDSIVDTVTGGHVEDALSIILMGILFVALPLAGGILLIVVGLKLRKPPA